MHADGLTELTILVTVKAYPSVSTKYGEAVCVAGVRLDTPEPEWVRLFPVDFRGLPREQQFAKYQIVKVRAQKHSSDRRAETWRPDPSTFVLGEKIPSGGAWPKRRPYVEPLVGPTMCALNAGRKGGGPGPSLGLVRPARIKGVKVEQESAWSEAQQSTLAQGDLFVAKKKADLVKPDHSFSYKYDCEEPGCTGHEQKIVDWELGESYRKWPQTGQALVDAIEARWLGEMCADGNEVLFFVGDQHARPGGFLVLGTFYPKRVPTEPQLGLGI